MTFRHLTGSSKILQAGRLALAGAFFCFAASVSVPANAMASEGVEPLPRSEQEAAQSEGMVTQSEVVPFAASNCGAGYACLWRDNDYKTAGSDYGYVRFADKIPYLYQWYYNGFPATSAYNADNSATSIYNQGVHQKACFYKDSAYKMPGAAAPFCLPQGGSGRNNLATSVAPFGWNDTISSAKFTN